MSNSDTAPAPQHPPHPRRHRPLPTRRQFARRLGRSVAAGVSLLVISLGIGTIGYHAVTNLSWLDAEYNAAMILTGMGPIDQMHSAAGKIFASAYAIFSGVAFLTGAGVVFAPIAHRFLHRFHVELED